MRIVNTAVQVEVAGVATLLHAATATPQRIRLLYQHAAATAMKAADTPPSACGYVGVSFDDDRPNA
jgi:hypothetical protein